MLFCRDVCSGLETFFVELLLLFVALDGETKMLLLLNNLTSFPSHFVPPGVLFMFALQSPAENHVSFPVRV